MFFNHKLNYKVVVDKGFLVRSKFDAQLPLYLQSVLILFLLWLFRICVTSQYKEYCDA